MNKKDILAYEFDASEIKGKAKDVIFPRSIEEAQKMVKNQNRICIRGGGTGFVGGAVPEQGQDTVLDTSKLTNIGEYDKDRETIEVEAGVILEELQHHLAQFNKEFPINPFSESICTIGGMIATNASDSRILKYKDTENWIRWVEIITPEGKLERKGKTEISDYAGMEGITGLIVKACLHVIPKKVRTATLVKIEHKDKIVEIVKHAKKTENITMIDFLDKKVSHGIGLTEEYHLIIEYDDETGILKDSAYEELMSKHKNMYRFLVSEGYTRIEDPKIMIDKFPEIFDWIENKHIPMYAHLSVGILHPCFYKGQEKYIPELLNIVKRAGGKVAGKHGIGIRKKEYVEPNDKKIIENIKKRTDGKNKFNIGKVI